MKKIFFCFFFLISLVGCQDLTPVKKPDNLIPQEKMEEIMYQTLLLKSARGYNIGKLTAAGIDPENYIYDIFDIDSIQFKENTAYYVSQFDTYRAMNERIKERLFAVLEVEDSLNTLEKKISDSLRLKRLKDAELERLAKKKEDSLKVITRDSIM